MAPARRRALGLLSRRANAAAALALALVAALVLAAHVRNLQHAGPLERDECNSAAFAARPLGAAWSSLRYDSVPFASTLLFHAWTRIGLGTDAGLRALGLLIGCAVIAALVWHARLHGAPYPAASLLLLALHPNAIRFGDAVRPTGLGLLALVLAAGSLWRALRRPAPGSIGLAAACAVLAVQTLYPNAALLAALCLAGVAVAWRRKSPGRAALSVGIGLTAAASLLVYVPTLRAAREWLPLVQSPPDQFGIWLAIGSPRPWDAWLWIAVILGGLAGALARRRPRERPAGAGPGDDSPWSGGDGAVFAAVALVAGVLAQVGFIAAMRVTAKPWYYLPLMALVVLCLDALLGPLLRRHPARWIAAFALAAISALNLGWGRDVLDVRQTNLDVVADSLAAEAGPHDLVVVNPWYCGVTLHRYLRAVAPWVTVPPLEDLSIHRFDLIRKRMESAGVMDSVLARVTRTLAGGGRVWLVGYLPPPPREGAAAPPPAPALGWKVETYATAWGAQVSALIASHAERGRTIDVDPGGEVSMGEVVKLRAIEGWH